MKVLHIVVAAALLSFCSMASVAKSQVLELSHEASADSLRLPVSVDGELSVQGCATCKTLRLRASATTRYTIGKEDVTLAELTKYIELHPTVVLSVMHRKGSLELTRVVIPAPANAK